MTAVESLIHVFLKLVLLLEPVQDLDGRRVAGIALRARACQSTCGSGACRSDPVIPSWRRRANRTASCFCRRSRAGRTASFNTCGGADILRPHTTDAGRLADRGRVADTDAGRGPPTRIVRRFLSTDALAQTRPAADCGPARHAVRLVGV